MDAFKKFLSNKKVNKHFKKSGQGARLDGQSSSQPVSQVDRVAQADMAAHAAMKRNMKQEDQVSASRKKIQMIALRELEEERKRNETTSAVKQLSLQSRSEPETREFEHSGAISQVFYSCDLLGEDVSKPKHELMKDLEDFLADQAGEGQDSATVASVFMIYSLNKPQQKETAIETIGKYVQNILEHPGEEKYCKIRKSNKAFQERVAATKGGEIFLKSIGFDDVEENGETFLINRCPDDGILINALEQLRNGQSVPVKVSRSLQIFSLQEGQKVKSPQLSADFYALSAEEVKREQQAKTEQVEQMMMLRTKEMRKKDETLRNYRYKYTLIRIRFPGNILVQGVFGCYEPFSAVRMMVASILSDEAQCSEFTLRDVGGNSVDDETQCLAEYGLAPAATLHISFSTALTESPLSEEALEKVEPLET